MPDIDYVRRPLVLATNDARQYIGFSREMWDEALEMGLIQRLPIVGPHGAHLYDVRDLEAGGQRYLDYLKRKHADGVSSA